MNEARATEYAASKNLAVSKTKRTTLEGRFFGNKPAVRHEITVGRIVCFYETDKGGAACWQLQLDGTTVRAGYKSDAILRAVNQQI